jgi:maltooligosyltrehalose trehalohydrolase
LSSHFSLGATYQGDAACKFRVWAPIADKVEVHLLSGESRWVELGRERAGYFSKTLNPILPGALYRYRLDGVEEYADPASRFQPEGVFGPSQVVDRDFPWEDAGWSGISLAELVIYEMHVGTFTGRGTFEAIISHLDELKVMGVTALELMPVAQFSGERNWGYDGVFPYAVQNSYGGPVGLKRLVNACHRKGLAVVLDVVYNHLGPEGCIHGKFGPYFTDVYRTPWGSALNFDQAFSDEVRKYFVQNAEYWREEFHIDALRLDALHAIFDPSPTPFLLDLSLAMKKAPARSERPMLVIAESDANDRRIVTPIACGGLGMDGHWNEDFHHAVHALLTGERRGYYRDFGRLGQLVQAYRQGFVYTGQYSAFRKRRHGSSSREIEAFRHIVFIQNHDQVGNRPGGERLSALVDFEQLKLAAGLSLFSPYVPLIFMGEEYGETAPFRYFVSHSNVDLIEAVRRGRRNEFPDVADAGELSDPQAPTTFQSAKLQHELKTSGRHKVLLNLYREMLRLRRAIPALSNLSKDYLSAEANPKTQVISVLRGTRKDRALIVYNFAEKEQKVEILLKGGWWKREMDTAARKWGGCASRVSPRIWSAGEVVLNLQAHSCLLLVLEREQR